MKIGSFGSKLLASALTPQLGTMVRGAEMTDSGHDLVKITGTPLVRVTTKAWLLSVLLRVTTAVVAAAPAFSTIESAVIVTVSVS